MQKNAKSAMVLFPVPLIIGGLSALITAKNTSLFENVIKPPLAPPPIVFPIVWTILYILLGWASFLIFNAQGPKYKINNALTVYAVQLIFNFFWPIFFFNFRLFSFSFVWLVLLFAAVIICTLRFYKIRPAGAYLLLPYLLWLIIAGYLNLYIAIYN